jgi:hypothetical protein
LSFIPSFGRHLEHEVGHHIELVGVAGKKEQEEEAEEDEEQGGGGEADGGPGGAGPGRWPGVAGGGLGQQGRDVLELVWLLVWGSRLFAELLCPQLSSNQVL